MNKAELISALASKTGKPQTEAKAFLEAQQLLPLFYQIDFVVTKSIENGRLTSYFGVKIF